MERAERATRREAALKRTFDVVVASMLLFLAAPLILLTAIGSAMALRAWPFFIQDRIGRGGETFRFIKVRTLPVSTDAYADKYALAEVRTPTFTRALRTLHLDELPQLALVVLGRMSLVGPRPEMPPLNARLPRHFATTRSLVRPGCTGLWQVGVHCNGLIGEAPGYDRLYVVHHTMRLDIWIMVQTALKVARGGRARVRLDDVPSWTSPTLDPAAGGPEPVVIDLTGLLVTDHRALQDSDA